MRDKILVIISTSEKEKALTGMMYAVNSMMHGWMEDVQLFLFGPAEKLFPKDEELQKYLGDFIDMNGEPVACKFIADKNGGGEELTALGLNVDYVGEKISRLIKDGYVPLIW
jgi:hypothetical protein